MHSLVLGIESSCDETAAAVVAQDGTILSNIISSQIVNHERFGGVVPEIAARAHLDQIEVIIDTALKDANVGLKDLSGIAATCGPGLVGGVIVGMMAGKTLALMNDKPFIGINHLEGHVLSPQLSDNVAFPYLVLLISGAHTQILIAHDLGHYEMLGTTLDDACGECFDKVGRMLGLPFPGGKYVAALAAKCVDRAEAAKRFSLPKPLKGREGCDFSFSGLKTAVLRHVEKLSENCNPVSAHGDAHTDLAASFEDAVADVILDRMEQAITIFKKHYPNKKAHIVTGGGVAANKTIKARLADLTSRHQMIFTAPPSSLCTDNGAMIAWAGLQRLNRGLINSLDMKARPRWPLEELKKEFQPQRRRDTEVLIKC